MTKEEHGGRSTQHSSVPSFLQSRTFRAFLAFLRRIAGMPDYELHVEYLRRCHPEGPIPSERQFYEEYLRARYGEGPTRCC